MSSGSFQILIATLYESLERLHARISIHEIEDLAFTIHRAMTDEARSFHRLEHVFSFLGADNPIHNLAALYHDIIYYQVDAGISKELFETLNPYLIEVDDNLYLQRFGAEDRSVQILSDLFNYSPGQILSLDAGLNEFLSALVMLKKLSSYLNEKDLISIAGCIEATIPFRGLDHSGKSPFEVMESRLIRISDNYGLSWTNHDIFEMVTGAVVFSNQDVQSFAEEAACSFLEGTWKLLPELNSELRAREIYSIKSYRVALEKMEGFYSVVDPDQIFHQYRGTPGNEMFDRMKTLARQNIQYGQEYLRVKLVAIALFEALAEISGGDAPLSLFAGDLPRPGKKAERIRDYFPPLGKPLWVDPESVIYRILHEGRSGESGFDTEDSPTALLVYCSLSPEQFQQTLNAAHRMFSGLLSAHDFLMTVDRSLVSTLAKAAARMVFTRRTKLLEYA